MNIKEKILNKITKKEKVYELEVQIDENSFLVSKNIKKKIIDKNGNINYVTKKVFNIVSNGSLSSKRWFNGYLLNEDGTCIYEIEINEDKNKYGAINRFGENTVEPIYDGLAFGTEDTLVAVNGENIGFVDVLTGKQITPIIFKQLSHFKEGLAEVEWNGLKGYVKRDEHMTNPNNPWEYQIAPKFTQAGDFESGVAEVEYEGNMYYINKDGVFITKETARLLKKHF